jgi:hypothetical protein
MADKQAMLDRAARLSQSSLHRTARDAADRASGLNDHAVWLALDDLTLDNRIQVRVDGLDVATVERYATIMQENAAYEPFPPVIVYRDGDTFWLSAGFHRVAAAHQAGLVDVRAEVRPGGFESAYWHAITDNLANGLQMSYADQKEALRRLLGLDVDMPDAEEYVTMSDRQLASIIGVSHPTISKWRAELVKSTGKGFPVDSNVRVGADGKVRDVSGIQAANQARQQADDPDPTPADAQVSLADSASENESGSYTAGAQDEPFTPPSLTKSGSRARDWRATTRREIVSHLREAAAGLQKLQDIGGPAIARYAAELAREWGLDERD